LAALVQSPATQPGRQLLNALEPVLFAAERQLPESGAARLLRVLEVLEVLATTRLRLLSSKELKAAKEMAQRAREIAAWAADGLRTRQRTGLREESAELDELVANLTRSLCSGLSEERAVATMQTLERLVQRKFSSARLRMFGSAASGMAVGLLR
jgi:hypothetical protein